MSFGRRDKIDTSGHINVLSVMGRRRFTRENRRNEQHPSCDRDRDDAQRYGCETTYRRRVADSMPITAKRSNDVTVSSPRRLEKTHEIRN